MQPRTSPARQAITGMIVAVAVLGTLVCGLTLSLSERGPAVANQLPTPTPTLFHLATLTPNSPTRIPTREPTRPAPTVIIIPTSSPVASEATPTPMPPKPTTAVTARPSQCMVTAGWQPYLIQPGDTLFLIGLRYGLTVDGIMRGNCLNDTQIEAGDTLYVPPVTPFAVGTSQFILTTTWNPIQPTLALTATGTQTATDGACTNPDSTITSPKVGQIIIGTIPIIGTARVPNFAFYKIEIRQEGTPMTYANLYTGDKEVSAGALAPLNTANWPNGEYWLRLVVVDTDGNYPERCAMLVTFNNR